MMLLAELGYKSQRLYTVIGKLIIHYARQQGTSFKQNVQTKKSRDDKTLNYRCSTSRETQEPKIQDYANHSQCDK